MAILYGFGKSRERARKQFTRVAKELRKTLSRKLYDVLSGEAVGGPGSGRKRENKKSGGGGQLELQQQQLADSMPQSDSSSQSGTLSAAQELSRALEQMRAKVFQMSMCDIYALLSDALQAVGELFRKFLASFDESVQRSAMDPAALFALSAPVTSGSMAPALVLPMLESLKMLLDLFNRVRHTSGVLILLESLLQFELQLGAAAKRAAYRWAQVAQADAPAPAWLLNLYSYNTHLAVVLVAVTRSILPLVLLNPTLSSLLFEACVASLPDQLLANVFTASWAPAPGTAKPFEGSATERGASGKLLECTASERVVLDFLCFLYSNYPSHFVRHVWHCVPLHCIQYFLTFST